MTDQELETVVTYVKDRLPEPATQSPALITGLGVLITIYRFLGPVGG